MKKSFTGSITGSFFRFIFALVGFVGAFAFVVSLVLALANICLGHTALGIVFLVICVILFFVAKACSKNS